MITIDVLRDELQKEYEICKSWAQIARRYSKPITRAHVYKIVRNGWEPESAHIRAALGLDLSVTVPACPLCGLAHTHAHNEQVYDPTAQVVKPKPKPRNPRPARIAIRKDDMQSAARSIVNHMTASDVDVLIVELRDLLLGENPLDKKNYREEE